MAHLPPCTGAGAKVMRRPTVFLDLLDLYAWYLLIATLDILVTSVVLHVGGEEVNPVASGLLEHFGLAGLAAFKLISVAVVVSICHYIAGLRPTGARALAWTAIVVSAFPVAYGLSELAAY